MIVYCEDGETLVLGGAIFPEGMFGLISILKDGAALDSLRSVLAEARPGPSRAK